MSKPSRMLFVNLPVKDLTRAKTLFAALGFTFNPQFTDDNAACMVVNDQALVMLLAEPFFQGFTSRTIADTRTHAEGLFGVSCASRAEVDELMDKALAAGATGAERVQDHGFMYGRAFYDLDGHHWEVMWMDPATVQ